jgi:uncharacterized protein YktB (UPF0637 family)
MLTQRPGEAGRTFAPERKCRVCISVNVQECQCESRDVLVDWERQSCVLCRFKMGIFYILSTWGMEREKKESEMYGGCLVKNSKHIFDLIDDNFTWNVSYCLCMYPHSGIAMDYMDQLRIDNSFRCSLFCALWWIERQIKWKKKGLKIYVWESEKLVDMAQIFLWSYVEYLR